MEALSYIRFARKLRWILCATSSGKRFPCGMPRIIFATFLCLIPSNDYHVEIMKIIEEEAESYFEGQKYAKQVADVIQNRVQLYLLEKQ